MGEGWEGGMQQQEEGRGRRQVFLFSLEFLFRFIEMGSPYVAKAILYLLSLG